MIALILSAFVVVNILLALYDAKRIGKGKKISHALNGAIYLALVAGAVWFNRDYFLAGALLVMRLIVFNISLNLFRDFRWNYIPQKPAAVTDKIARAIFGRNSSLMYAILVLVLAGLVICSYLN